MRIPMKKKFPINQEFTKPHAIRFLRTDLKEAERLGINIAHFCRLALVDAIRKVKHNNKRCPNPDKHKDN